VSWISTHDVILRNYFVTAGFLLVPALGWENRVSRCDKSGVRNTELRSWSGTPLCNSVVFVKRMVHWSVA
jgi:hypothetical protein